MKLGYVLPHIGRAASPQAIIQVAKRAEELDLDSLWVTERLLFPISPQTKYPGTPDGFLPEPYKIVIDPLQGPGPRCRQHQANWSRHQRPGYALP